MSEGLDLISSIIERGSTVTFRLLDAELFVGKEERSVYDFIRNHYRRHSELPTIETIEESLDVQIPDAPEHVDYYLDLVYSRRMYNAVRRPFNAMHDALTGRKKEEVRNYASLIYAATRESTPEHDLRTLGDLTLEADRNYRENMLSESMTGIPTGWITLDKETSGYQNGDLVVWVARPGLGKTHLLIHQAKAAWLAGKSTLFVSMEMSLHQITNRFLGHYASINPEFIKRGELSYWSKRRFDDAILQLGDDRRFHIFAGNMGKTTDDVDQLIQELAPDIIYWDGMYLSKPRAGSKARNRYDTIAYVLDDIKEMTITRDRPIVATTQFSKGAGREGVEGSLETIGYTDTISTHASIITAILPPNKKRIKQYGTSKFREIILMKGREGESEGFNVAYSFSPMAFFELTPPPPDDSTAINEIDSSGSEAEHIQRSRMGRRGGRTSPWGDRSR
jgi:replicative DNA helicase